MRVHPTHGALRGIALAAVFLTQLTAMAEGQISFERMMTLGDTDEAGFLSGYPEDVRILPDGRFIVAATDARLAKVYDSSGRFLVEIGTEGEGPGEYMRVVATRSVPGDSLLVVDVGHRRISLLDPKFRFVRSFTMPAGPFHDMSEEWPTPVLSQSIPSPRRIGLPLHRIAFSDAGLSIEKSFGGDQGEYRPGSGFEVFNRISNPSDDGSFWTSPSTSVDLQRYDAEGDLVRRLSLAPEWFETREGVGTLGSPTVPPPSRVEALHQTNGRVWVIGRIAAESWEKGWGSAEPGAREIRMMDIRVPELFDSVIDIYDGESGELLCSRLFPGLITQVLPDRTLVSFELGELDRPLVGIWKVSASGDCGA